MKTVAKIRPEGQKAYSLAVVRTNDPDECGARYAVLDSAGNDVGGYRYPTRHEAIIAIAQMYGTSAYEIDWKV